MAANGELHMDKVEASVGSESVRELQAETEIKSRILAKIAADVHDKAELQTYDRGSHDRYTKSP
jgi:hypothetical protein